MQFIRGLLGLTMLMVSTYSSATGNTHEPIESAQRWHYGLGIGLSILAYNDKNITSIFSDISSAALNSNDFTFKLFAGYRIDPFLTLEFGLTELGTSIDTSNNNGKLFNTYSSYFNMTMQQAYNDRAALFGKIGVHFWSQGLNRTSALADGTDLSLGAGLEFKLYGKSGKMMRVEWNRYLFDNLLIKTIDTLTLNLLLEY